MHTSSPSPAVATPFDLLAPPIQKALSEKGYRTPTPIQGQAIPHLLNGADLIGCAQTGTGKTAAFTLPILQHLHKHPRRAKPCHPRALVLAPTRELAAQIGDSIRAYGRFMHVRYVVIFGGVGQNPQVQGLRRGADIVVATPGRLLDLMNQRFCDLSHVEVVVLDEADRMFDMGFLPDVKRIIARVPEKRQSLLFSATMPDEVRELTSRFVRNPVNITIAPEKPAVDRIRQKVMFVDRPNKASLLIKLLESQHLDRVVVFARTKNGADKVTRKLEQSGISTAVIHGNKSQNARTTALSGFKNGRIRVLVATDLASRGIDVESISHVINYDLPNEPETYVHRIGRTARAGEDGDAISFCSAEERNDLRAIERFCRMTIPVDVEHEFHDEHAKNATGAAARRQHHGGHRPRPKQHRGPPRRPGEVSRPRPSHSR